MVIGANTYGDPEDVAGLVPRNANAGGVFDATTRPTLTQVESYLDQVSSQLNILLAEQGFQIPITQADCKLILGLFVNQEVAAIIEGINGSGRFGPSITRGVQASRFTLVMRDVAEFVKANAAGIERLGATRNHGITDGIAFRDTDRSGQATFPLFTRKSFGGETFRDEDV